MAAGEDAAVGAAGWPGSVSQPANVIALSAPGIPSLPLGHCSFFLAFVPPCPLRAPPPRSPRHAHSGLPNEGVNATGRDFFRGALVTRADGSATFRTIVPGWYWTRLAHVHLKVRLSPPPPRGSPANFPDAGFVTQLFFPPPFLRRVYATEPYARRAARRGGRGGDADEDAYTATVGTDFELRGDWRKYQALQLSPRPATEGWLRANGFAVPPRWRRRQGKGGRLGYVASYTLRLRW